MDLTEIKLKTVMYFMQTLVLYAGGEAYEVPRTMIQGIDIDKQFESAIFPVWMLTVGVPQWFYKKITNNAGNITVSMNLQYRFGDTNEAVSSPTGAFTTEVAGTFKGEIAEDTPITDGNVQDNLAKSAGSYNKTHTDTSDVVFIDISLYNINAREASLDSQDKIKKLNKVFSSINLMDAFVHCLNQYKIKNMMMVQPDDKTMYGQFKILPKNGVQNMIRILEDYKFHNNGSLLFFDLVDSYLLPKKPGCFAWKNNEFKTTHFLSLSSMSEPMGNYDGVFINSKEKYNVISVPSNAFSTETLDNSPGLQKAGENNFLTIMTSQATMSLLSPNKEFIVNIDSANAAKFNGKYRIRSMGLKLTPNGELLNPAFTIVLRR